MCFEYTAEDILVMLTDDCMLYLLKPKEEDCPITKDLTVEIGNTLVEGAKVHENLLVVLTSSKKVFLISSLSDCKAKPLIEKPYCKFAM